MMSKRVLNTSRCSNSTKNSKEFNASDVRVHVQSLMQLVEICNGEKLVKKYSYLSNERDLKGKQN